MSRTTLCVLTAAALASLSLGMAIVHARVLGQETQVAHGPGTYKVTMRVRGHSSGDARLLIACPLDFHRQHIFGEEYSSSELAPKIVDSGDRRALQWAQRLTTPKGPVQAHYDFFCTVDVSRPTASMKHLHKTWYAPPKPGENLAASPGINPNDAEITRLALELTGDLKNKVDQARALFHFVGQTIVKEPTAGGPSRTARDCLKTGRGDALAQSRLLAALCRNRGLPARLVTGLTLGKTIEQKAHVWAEVWTGDYWLPMCPFHHHFGRVPATYLVFGFGDMKIVRGQHLRDLDYACLIEHKKPQQDAAAGQSPVRRFFTRISLYTLPPAEMRLVEFLLLLPLAALIVCVYRNVIGLHSFGTFAPALIGLAFRDLESLPGILIFVAIILIGWGMRRVLDHYHLLQVPRTAFMLSLVIGLLITIIVAANYQEVAATRYISLFPLVILTGMIERFWTMETEDGPWSSFKALVGTIVVAASVSLVVSLPGVVPLLVQYPEILGVIMAGQLLIGRYTGYRLLELYRFRDFLKQPASPDCGFQISDFGLKIEEGKSES